MKQIGLPLVMGLLVSFGCRAIPGQDVRYEPTPMPVVRAMLELADVGPQDVVYDLGSGDGRIPITAAKEFGARGVGIEIDPTLVRQAQAKAREAGVADKVEFRLGDMYVADVRPATVVTLFLHPEPNLKLRPKLRSDLQAGSRVVSYAWDMADWVPDEARPVNAYRIFLWRIRHRAARIIGPQEQHQRGVCGTSRGTKAATTKLAEPRMVPAVIAVMSHNRSAMVRPRDSGSAITGLQLPVARLLISTRVTAVVSRE